MSSIRYSGWKEVKARKDYQCLCCGGQIAKGEKYYVVYAWEENRQFPQVDRYCSACGIWVKQGYSFNEARTKAFGSTLQK